MMDLVVITFAAAALGGFSLLGELRRTQQPHDWGRVAGRIIASQVTGKGGVRLEYQYTVDGELYRGSTRLSGVTDCSDEELASLYRVGCPLRITFDPQRPWQSLVDDACHRQFQLDALLVSLVVMLMGILALVGLVLDAVAR